MEKQKRRQLLNKMMLSVLSVAYLKAAKIGKRKHSFYLFMMSATRFEGIISHVLFYRWDLCYLGF